MSDSEQFVMVTHTVKDYRSKRVRDVKTVTDLVEALPSMKEPIVDPLPFDPAIYNQWARASRSKPSSRGTARASCSPQPCSDSTLPPPTPISRIASKNYADTVCTSLDNILDEYDRLFPPVPQTFTQTKPKPSKTVSRRKIPRIQVSGDDRDIILDQEEPVKTAEGYESSSNAESAMYCKVLNSVLTVDDDSDASQNFPKEQNSTFLRIPNASTDFANFAPKSSVKKSRSSSKMASTQSNTNLLPHSCQTENDYSLNYKQTWNPEKTMALSCSAQILEEPDSDTLNNITKSVNRARKLSTPRVSKSSSNLPAIGNDFSEFRFTESSSPISANLSTGRSSRHGFHRKRGSSSCSSSSNTITDKNIRALTVEDLKRDSVPWATSSNYSINTNSVSDGVHIQTVQLDSRLSSPFLSETCDEISENNNKTRHSRSRSKNSTWFREPKEKRLIPQKLSKTSRRKKLMKTSREPSQSDSDKRSRPSRSKLKKNELPSVQFMDLKDLKAIFDQAAKAKLEQESRSFRGSQRPVGTSVSISSAESQSSATIISD